jgi:hypothetical protein
MQLGMAPVTIGWVLALLVLVLAVVFIFVGTPDPRVPLALIAILAVARVL